MHPSIHARFWIKKTICELLYDLQDLRKLFPYIKYVYLYFFLNLQYFKYIIKS